MEVMIYLKSLARYLTDASDSVREELYNELRERHHHKGHQSTELSETLRSVDRMLGSTGKLARLVVNDPKAPASVLSRLSDSEEPAILVRVAEHSRTSPYTLALLAESKFYEVRQAVSENISTPFSVLQTLAQDEHVDVRFRMAENPKMCITLLQVLEEDENPYISERARRTIERRTAEFESIASIASNKYAA